MANEKKKLSKEQVKSAPKPGRVERLTQTEVHDLVIKPAAEARPVFDYLAEWRSQSLRSTFSFGANL